MMNIHEQNKQDILNWRKSLYDLDVTALKGQMDKAFASDARIHLSFPFEDLCFKALMEEVYKPLIKAIPDLERRDYIVMAGSGQDGDLSGNWVGCAGHCPQ
ncbi:MAG: hypothetical protein R2880_14575 [Deinococcales bacterium]